MRARTALLAITCAASGATLAHAEGPADVTMMQGVCRRLATPSDELSKACAGAVVNTSYSRDGRVGFYFVTGDRAVTFSGGAKEIRVSDTSGVQAIDKVTVAAGRDAKAIVAVGSCRYANALTAKPTVNCKAETEEGNFLASFDVLHGSLPVAAVK